MISGIVFRMCQANRFPKRIGPFVRVSRTRVRFLVRKGAVIVSELRWCYQLRCSSLESYKLRLSVALGVETQTLTTGFRYCSRQRLRSCILATVATSGITVSEFRRHGPKKELTTACPASTNASPTPQIKANYEILLPTELPVLYLVCESFRRRAFPF